MNCQEARNLVERVIDRNLSGGVKRRFDLHLSRCEECRAFFAAEQAEHQRWFRAVNSPDEPRHSLPPDFADRLVAAVVAHSALRRSFFMRMPRWTLLAASLVLMAGFVFAAATVGGRLSATAETSPGGDEPVALKGTQATEETEATLSDLSIGVASVSYVPDVPLVPSASSTSPTKGKDKTMTRKKAAAALTAAMAAAPLAAANGDEYQFIVSGEVVVATTGCSSDSSETAALVSGPLADGVVYDSELEARYRTMGESSTCSLRSDKSGSMISFR